jgi:cob(I)alamin adenosyltransferase
MSDRKQKKGLVIVNTGRGKGKTTAAFGVLMRAWGHGMRTCVIQFIKGRSKNLGEVKAAERMGIEWHQLGEGFTRLSDDLDASAEKARHAWALAQEKIAGGAYDLIVLDEFTYPLKYGWIDPADAIAWLREHKPPMLHVIITGRDAPPVLVAFADLVTEMRAVKHPLKRGVGAQRGIEF